MITIPNILTSLRIIAIPFFIYCLFLDDGFYRLVALIIFMLASVTDFFDGYFARKYNQDSKLGRFLDPLADKFLVIATLLAFLFLDKQIPLWMVLTIIGRDMLITLMRFLAIRKGIEVRTTRLAKAKTTFQMFSIVLIVMILMVRSFQADIQRTFQEGKSSGKKHIEIAYPLLKQGIELLGNKDIEKRRKQEVFAESVPYFLMLLTTLITIVSGVRYLITNYRVLKPPYLLRGEQRGEP